MILETLQEFKVTYDCIPCAIGSLIKLLNINSINTAKKDEAMRGLLRYLSEMDYQQPPPELGQEMHRIIRDIFGNPDPYKQIKTEFNQLMLSEYDKLRQEVEAATDAFNMALRFAIAGNIIDFGPNHHFDINETIEQARSVELAIDHSEMLRSEIDSAGVILYLGDNAGEIVMDRLFLETINHPNVYFAVRGGPVINDVTIDDAQDVGMDKIATVVSNGQNAPGILLKTISEEFRKLFERADLIISKGQGNYEGLANCQKNIYFLLMAKCEHVAAHIGVNRGDFVVINNLHK
ncbi:DUF89 family protein [candidate division KSB1 bacterium]|nr:DUF89 family protein [candidate division KSB1 bacterium]